MPWWHFAALLNQTETLWHSAPSVDTRFLCEGPPCADCAHVAGQKGCAVDIELTGLPPRIANVTTCFPKCRFTKAQPPQVPGHCWNRSAGAPVGDD